MIKLVAGIDRIKLAYYTPRLVIGNGESPLFRDIFDITAAFWAVASLRSSNMDGWRFFVTGNFAGCRYLRLLPVCVLLCGGSMAKIKAILFDLGDTLLDFGSVDMLELFAEGARLAYAYLRQLGQPLPPFAKFHRQQLHAVQWHLLKSHLTGREFNSLDVLSRSSRAMGQKLTPAETEELAWLWYEPLSRCVTIEDSLGEVLEGFRRHGLSLAVVSNTFVPGQVLDRHMTQLGLLEYFPVRIYSCDVRHRKPHPKIFRMCLARLGISPSEAIFVGDKLRADVSGAGRVGMITVLKDPSGVKRRRGIRPSHRITSLRQLPAIVAGYNSP